MAVQQMLYYVRLRTYSQYKVQEYHVEVLNTHITLIYLAFLVNFTESIYWYWISIIRGNSLPHHLHLQELVQYSRQGTV